MYPAVSHLRFTSSVRNISSKTPGFRRNGLEGALLMCNEGSRPGFHKTYHRGDKREWKMEWWMLQQTHVTDNVCWLYMYIWSPLCSFLHFNSGSFTRGVQFTTSCHEFHLHNSRNALFMWSAAFLYHLKMGFFPWTITRRAFLYHPTISAAIKLYNFLNPMMQ